MAEESEATLAILERIARTLGDERSALDAAALAARVKEGRYFVACVGQFKRGKSTLLNALVGERILPVGVLPVTTVPTILRYGDRLRARIRFGAGSWQEVDPRSIAQFTSQELNPDNVRGVAGIEVFVPSPVLSGGLCLVDTPGVGSVFRNNTEATRDFLPQIDAVLVVAGADPPMSESELSLLEEIGPNVEHVLVVLNKADRVTLQEMSAARDFTARIFRDRLGRAAEPIYEVSAIERLEGVGRARDWGRLGERLRSIQAGAGAALLEAARERGATRLAARLAAEIQEQRTALQRPLTETAQRIGRLRELAAAGERAVLDLRALFQAEADRLAEEFGARRTRFLAEVQPVAREELRAALARITSQGLARRSASMALAQEIGKHQIAPWFAVETADAGESFRRGVGRLASHARDLLRRLAEEGDASQLMPLAHELDAASDLTAPPRFFFHPLERVAGSVSIFGAIRAFALGLLRRRGVIDREASRLLEQLLEINSSRVAYGLIDRMRESCHSLEAALRGSLAEALVAAERARDRAANRWAQGEAAVSGESARLSELGAQLDALVTADAGIPRP